MDEIAHKEKRAKDLKVIVGPDVYTPFSWL
jgi:hypothetical protein